MVNWKMVFLFQGARILRFHVFLISEPGHEILGAGGSRDEFLSVTGCWSYDHLELWQDLPWRSAGNRDDLGVKSFCLLFVFFLFFLLLLLLLVVVVALARSMSFIGKPSRKIIGMQNRWPKWTLKLFFLVPHIWIDISIIASLRNEDLPPNTLMQRVLRVETPYDA